MAAGSIFSQVLSPRPDGQAPPTIFRQTDNGFENVRSTIGLTFGFSEFGFLSDLTGDNNLDGVFSGAGERFGLRVYDLTKIPFKEVTATLNLNSLSKASDIISADFNGDLRPDLYLTRDRDPLTSNDQLLLNTKQGFVDFSQKAGINSIPIARSSVVSGDFDNDMDLDLYIVATGSAGNRAKANILYQNQGDGTFIAVPDAAGATGTKLGVGDSVVTADYDLDGFLDLFVTNGWGANYPKDGPYQLFHNQGNDNHWLEVDLEGVVSNRDGIGAQVFVTAGDVTQLGEQSGGIHHRA